MLLAGLALLSLGTCGAPYQGALAGLPVAEAEAEPSCGTIADFYRTNRSNGIWMRNGKLTPAGRDLERALSQASADGLDPAHYLAPKPEEHALSAAFVRYAQNLTGGAASESVYYVDGGLRPARPCPSSLLREAAAVGSPTQLLQRLQSPNVVAAALRSGLAASMAEPQRESLSRQLALARSIGSPRRFVLVDTNSQRLWMIDGNRAAGTMKVVVGKSGMDTPKMAGLIRFAVLNPYWDIPPDVVRNEVAPRVEAAGPGYLHARRYETVTSYEDDGVAVDPQAIDWRAVRNGSQKIGVHQLPGPDNMMGRVMFMFPNKFGIYLHDTPIRWVFSRADRRLSHGCVRLEHADALYRWLFAAPLTAAANVPPQTRQDLQQSVPVYILPVSPGRL